MKRANAYAAIDPSYRRVLVTLTRGGCLDISLLFGEDGEHEVEIALDEARLLRAELRDAINEALRRRRKRKSKSKIPVAPASTTRIVEKPTRGRCKRGAA
jgi:hypothetical protein